MYGGEFGRAETLQMSNTCNMNNPQMLMLWEHVEKFGIFCIITQAI